MTRVTAVHKFWISNAVVYAKSQGDKVTQTCRFY